MQLEINNRSMNINTVDIQGDGNCLFLTEVHQLKCVKIDSETHKTQTAELRTQVVGHIVEHIDDHKQALKMRLNCDIEQVDEFGTKFVTEELSRNGFWGDTESLLAVSNM